VSPRERGFQKYFIYILIILNNSKNKLGLGRARNLGRIRPPTYGATASERSRGGGHAKPTADLSSWMTSVRTLYSVGGGSSGSSSGSSGFAVFSSFLTMGAGWTGRLLCPCHTGPARVHRTPPHASMHTCAAGADFFLRKSVKSIFTLLAISPRSCRSDLPNLMPQRGAAAWRHG
jgi:hypothetical protein